MALGSGMHVWLSVQHLACAVVVGHRKQCSGSLGPKAAAAFDSLNPRFRKQEALHANTTGLPYDYDVCGTGGLEYDRRGLSTEQCSLGLEWQLLRCDCYIPYAGPATQHSTVA